MDDEKRNLADGDHFAYPNGEPPVRVENYRIDHYYLLEGDGEIEEGHIFCTPAEADEIAQRLRGLLPGFVTVTVEGGGEYDYTTEGASAEAIADSIAHNTGFTDELLEVSD